MSYVFSYLERWKLSSSKYTYFSQQIATASLQKRPQMSQINRPSMPSVLLAVGT